MTRLYLERAKHKVEGPAQRAAREAAVQAAAEAAAAAKAKAQAAAAALADAQTKADAPAPVRLESVLATLQRQHSDDMVTTVVQAKRVPLTLHHHRAAGALLPRSPGRNSPGRKLSSADSAVGGKGKAGGGGECWSSQLQVRVVVTEVPSVLEWGFALSRALQPPPHPPAAAASAGMARGGAAPGGSGEHTPPAATARASGAFVFSLTRVPMPRELARGRPPRRPAARGPPPPPPPPPPRASIAEARGLQFARSGKGKAEPGPGARR
jgi:hypothetical protein